MKKYIERIHGTIPSKKNKIDINTTNKSLIITGANGSGKTYFLSSLYRSLSNQIMLGEQESRASSAIVIVPELNELCEKIRRHSAVNLFFDAHRKADITIANAARGLVTERHNHLIDMQKKKVGGSLEEHLVNLKFRSSHAIAHESDLTISKPIEKWFEELEKNLKFLMEDETTRLDYNPGTLKFTIVRDEKPNTDFQSLSSGYASIFDIYSELLMRAAYLEISPSDLCGAVFIDEIEAHLHVSLQRLILPFLEGSFPGIQFLVTTHSPFILTSVSNSVAYDMSTNKTTDEDLSLYSYSAVMEGLLGTRTTSKVLDKLINEVALIVDSNIIDTERLRQCLSKISTSEYSLDSRSKAYYLLGVNALMDEDQKDV